MATKLQDVDALLGRRRLTVIPKDQLALLERGDSWAVDHTNKPHGLVNVPGHVLETVKEAYSAGRQQAQNQADNGDGTTNGQDGSHAQERATDTPASSPASSRPDSNMSWSESPPEQRPALRRLVASPATDERTKEPLAISPSPSSRMTLQPTSSQRTPQRGGVGSSPVTSPTRQASQALLSAVREKAPGPVKMAPPPRPSPPRRAAPAFELVSSDNEEEVTESPPTRSASRNKMATWQGRSISTASPRPAPEQPAHPPQDTQQSPPRRVPHNRLAELQDISMSAISAGSALSAAPTNPTAPLQKQPVHTPPCAQLSQSVVPETALKPEGPPKAAPSPGPRRRQRIMRPHSFSDDSPVVTKPRNALERMNIFDKLGSSNTASSSVVPSTMPEVPTQDSLQSPHSNMIRSIEVEVSIDSSPVKSVQPSPPAKASIPASTEALAPTLNEISASTPVGTSNPTEVEVLVPVSTQASVPASTAPQISTAPQNVDNGLGSKSLPAAITLADTKPQGQQIRARDASGPNETRSAAIADLLSNGFPDPFHTFALIYPDYTESYSGTLSRFIRACVCLEYLRQERALKDFLYDDFIRSFSAGFLAYVMNAGPGQEPLPAVEWYNNQPGMPVFTKMVVHSRNLDAVLKAYPDEVAQAKTVISGNTRPTEEIIRPDSMSAGYDDDAMEVDDSPPEPPKHRPVKPDNRKSKGPSPGSEMGASRVSSVPASTDERSTALPRHRERTTPASSLGRRRASGYLERLTSSSRSASKRSAEDRSEKLREHLRRRLSSRGRFDSTPNS